jgi:hypothetical protein
LTLILKYRHFTKGRKKWEGTEVCWVGWSWIQRGGKSAIRSQKGIPNIIKRDHWINWAANGDKRSNAIYILRKTTNSIANNRIRGRKRHVVWGKWRSRL